MGIKLESIELKNIRSHSHFIFKPKESGITVIAGENGTGKSSIVNSLAWTLFSTKPKGLSKTQGMMKENIPYAKGEFFSEVILQIDGEFLKIRKSIVSKGGSTECDVWSSTDNKNWVVKAGPAVSHAEPYIKRRLQMDEKEFLASVFIQQKQVDQLILANPAERSQVIEKLTGISSITEAVSLARKEYNQLQQTVGNTNINEDGLKELKNIKKENATKLKELEEKYEKLQKSVENLALERESLKELVEKNEEKVYKINALENKIQIIENQIENKRHLLENLTNDKNSKKEQLSRLTKNLKEDDYSAKLKEKELLLDNLNEQITQNKIKIKELALVKENFKKVLEKSSIKTLTEAKKEEKSILKTISKAEDLVENLNKDKYSLVGLVENFENAITVIEKHNGECPTCMQKVKNVESTVENLIKQKDNVKKQIDEINKTIKNNVTIKNEAEEGLKFNKILIEAFAVNEIVKNLEQLEEETKIKEGEKISVNAEIMSISKLYAESKNYENVKKEYNTLLSRAQTEAAELDKLEKGLIKADKIKKDFNVLSTEEIVKSRKKLDTLTESFSKKRESLLKLEGKKNLILEKNVNNDKEISKLEEDLVKYKKLLASVETSLSSVKLLEEFRADRINNSVSVIESYASEFLSKFTDSKFSGVKLDAKFNTTVILPNGTKRAVGMLSGGELSAVALALRFAIAFLLSSDDDRNLLILDEVLSAQDEVRVQAILDGIKETLKGQIILIGHNDNVKSIADKIVELS